MGGVLVLAGTADARPLWFGPVRAHPHADTTPPSPVSNLHGTTPTRTPNVSWSAATDSGSGIAGYNVYRDGALLAKTDKLSLTDSTAPAGSRIYAVRARDKAGNLSDARSVTILVDRDPPVTPSAPAAPTPTRDAPTLSWQPAQDVGGAGIGTYRIVRDGSVIARVDASVTAYTDGSLAAGDTHKYKLVAVDQAGNASSSSPAILVLYDTTPPGAPTGLAADSPTVASPRLTWAAAQDSTAGSGVAGYQVVRDGAAVATVSGTTYTDGSAAPGHTYAYAVRSVDAAGNVSSASDSVTVVYQDGTPPTVPTGVVDHTVPGTPPMVSWAAATDPDDTVVAYHVLRDGTEVGTTAETSFTDAGVTANGTYAYTVEAEDSSGNRSAPSQPLAVTYTDITAPDVPTGVSAPSPTRSPPVVSWAASADPDDAVAGYRISRDGAVLAQVTAGQRSYTDAAAVDGRTAAYTVAAVDSNGDVSDPSVEVDVAYDATPPAAPGGLTISAAGATDMTLAWSAPADNVAVTRYEVDLDGAPVGTTDATSFDATGLTCDTGYTISVAAEDAAGNRSPEATLAARTAACPQADGDAPSINIITPTPATGRNLWHDSGADGGGFQNVVAVDPLNPNYVLAGGDVSGISISTDGGDTWETTNGAGINVGLLKTAAITWSPTVPGEAFALVGGGIAGTNSGILETTDYGRSWARLGAGKVDAQGNNVGSNSLGLPQTHPRSVGTLLTIDPTARPGAPLGYLYVGTYNLGVVRVPLDQLTTASAWQAIALAPGTATFYIRSLVADPSDPTVLYASTYHTTTGDAGRVWRISDAQSDAPTAAELTGSPVDVEELAAVDGRLFGVAHDPATGDGGVYKLDAARTAPAVTAWTRIPGPNYSSSGTVWYSIAARAAGGTETLWVGTDAGPVVAGASQSIWKGTSDDGFATSTWTPEATGPGSVSQNVAGTVTPWWLLRTQAAYEPYGSGYTASDITIDPADPTRVFVAGRSGIWRTTDGGQSWAPDVEGLSVTVGQQILTDPNLPGGVFWGDTDYRLFWSTDHMQTITQAATPTSGVTVAHALTVDPTGGRTALYADFNARQAPWNGQIWGSADPTSAAGSTWTEWMTPSQSGGHQVMAVQLLRAPSGDRILLAALGGGGVLERDLDQAGSTWTKVSPSGLMAGSEGSFHAWFATAGVTSQIVYLYDRDSGLWRSSNQGQSWTKIYGNGGTDAEGTGFVALDPANPHRAIVSDATGIYLLTNADTSTGPAATTAQEISSAAIADPGPIAVANGRLYAVSAADQSHAPAFFQVALAALNGTSTPWQTDMNDARFAADANSAPVSLAVDGDGTLYLSMRENGVYVHDPGPSLTGCAAGTVTVRATAYDQDGIAGMQVRVNGGAWEDMALAGGVYSAPVSVSSQTSQIEVRAIDANAAGQATTVSDTVAVSS
jgi:chitodextrinase/photosystem II stability/assembly factor-like uncharacterized protein